MTPRTTQITQRRQNVMIALSLAPLAACGGGGSGSSFTASSRSSGNILPSDYVSQATPYTAPNAPDPNAFSLDRTLPDPYWVAALRSGRDDTVDAILAGSGRVITYVFPSTQPGYYTTPENTANWTPASDAVKAAFRDIFADVSKILNVTFVEGNNLSANNVIAISQTDQPLNTLGLAYYPETVLLLGSDVIIANAYDAPQETGNRTNIDYETLVHELGHALGLKHPHEAEGTNTVTLGAVEDSSTWTAMTYELKPDEFDGAFRPFDLMALTELYGVNPNYRAGNDTYGFNGGTGVFIVDGAGIDTISAANQAQAVLIDLRAGAQSYLGTQSNLISSANQLTISSGTKIENAIGGNGNDTLIGNALNNSLIGGNGNDRLFGGDGADQLRGGLGADIIDMSEVAAARDTVIFDIGGGGDLVYGFTQGALSDVINLAGQTPGALQMVIISTNVPFVTVTNETLRLVGAGLETAAGVQSALGTSGIFDAIDYGVGASALLITAARQATGEDQNLFHVSNTGALAVELLATFRGNYLDIDNWHSDNFA